MFVNLIDNEEFVRSKVWLVDGLREYFFMWIIKWK